jgi:hypothetical protein
VIWVFFNFSNERKHGSINALVGLHQEIDVAMEATHIFVKAVHEL